MSSSYTYYSDISVSGKVSSSKQGVAIGTVTVKPGTSGGLVASKCNGITVMYNGKFYTSNGTTWTEVSVGEENVQADWNQTSSSADDYIKNKPTLATVATSGSYNDLSNKPSLATVATSGSYNDLSGKPTIPTVPNLSKGTTTGSGNVVSDISVSGHTITLTKGVTALTEHQSLAAYAPLASPALTGTPTAPTASTGTNTTQIATTAFVRAEVDSRLAANDAMLFKGTIGTGGTVTALPSTHKAGWSYKVITAGTYAGVSCEVGDMIICITDGTSSNNAHWTVVQTNIDGAVTGPSSSTDAHVAVFNGTGGKVIKDSGFTIGKSVPSDALFTDTKNTAGTTASTGTKLYLVGATTQSANPTTVSNANCYVGTDNCLYSGGTKVLTSHQSLSDYVTKSGSEALTNKTYNGYTLGAACAKDIGSIASGNTGLVTGGTVYDALQNVGGAQIISNTTASSWVADSTYEGLEYRCAIPISGVTVSDVAEVIFAQAEAASGHYANVCETYAGGVYIYSTVDTSIVIPTILIHKG